MSCECSCNCSSNKQNSTKPLIRIGAYVLPPYVEECAKEYPNDPNCTSPGFDVLVMHRILGDIVNIEYQMFNQSTSTSNTTDHAETSISEQILSAIGKQEIDMTGNAMQVSRIYTHPSSSLFDYTVPVAEDRVVFLVRKYDKSISNSLSGVMSVFHWKIWVSLYAIFLFTLLIKYILAPMLAKMIVGKKKLTSRVHVQTYSLKCISFLFYLTIAIIMGLFGNLLAIVLNKKPEYDTTFQNAQELVNLVNSGKARIITYETLVPDAPELFLTNNSNSNNNNAIVGTNDFHEALKKRPALIVRNQADMIGIILQNNSNCWKPSTTNATTNTSNYTSVPLNTKNETVNSSSNSFHRFCLPNASFQWVGIEYISQITSLRMKTCDFEIVVDYSLPARYHVHAYRANWSFAALVSHAFSSGSPIELYNLLRNDNNRKNFKWKCQPEENDEQAESRLNVYRDWKSKERKASTMEWQPIRFYQIYTCCLALVIGVVHGLFTLVCEFIWTCKRRTVSITKL